VRALAAALMLLAVACAIPAPPSDAERRVAEVVVRTAAVVAPGRTPEPIGADPWSTQPCGALLGTGTQRRYWVVVRLEAGEAAQAHRRAAAFWAAEGFEPAAGGAREGESGYQISVDARRRRAIVAGSTPCTA
jgi:hypothetical protein